MTVELFAEDTAADVQQKEDDYFVPESRCDVIGCVTSYSCCVSWCIAIHQLARAHLGDSNEDVDLEDMIMMYNM